MTKAEPHDPWEIPESLRRKKAKGSTVETTRQTKPGTTAQPGLRHNYTPKQYAAEIRKLNGQTVQNIIAIGERLAEAKKNLQHGEWRPFVEQELRWSIDRAKRYMRVAAFFRNRANLHDLPAKVPLLDDMRANLKRRQPGNPHTLLDQWIAEGKVHSGLSYEGWRKVVGNQHKAADPTADVRAVLHSAKEKCTDDADFRALCQEVTEQVQEGLPAYFGDDEATNADEPEPETNTNNQDEPEPKRSPPRPVVARITEDLAKMPKRWNEAEQKDRQQVREKVAADQQLRFTLSDILGQEGGDTKGDAS